MWERFSSTSQSVKPDMFAVHAYKWLISPNGAGFMYVSPELRERLRPNVVGWRSHKDWRRVDSLHHGAPEFVDSAEKYEGGMLNFPSLYAMGASVEMMLELGPERDRSIACWNWRRSALVRSKMQAARSRIAIRRSSRPGSKAAMHRACPFAEGAANCRVGAAWPTARIDAFLQRRVGYRPAPWRR